MLRVAPIVEKMLEFCLKQFGYVWRRPIEDGEPEGG